MQMRIKIVLENIKGKGWSLAIDIMENKGSDFINNPNKMLDKTNTIKIMDVAFIRKAAQNAGLLHLEM